MRSYWNIDNSYSQISVEELRRKAEESIKKAEKKGKQMEPVITSGRQICKSWWGQAWCSNLEQYADFSSRLDRGKRYVRSGAVIDLKVLKGKIEARVQGTRRTPYKVKIQISPLSEDRCQEIIKKCGRKIINMEALIHGTIPNELKELFTGNHGLFPSPKEISFQCSCPDWALMCKHVAAVMYGIGVRVDQNPFFFFELRGIDVDRFIDVTLENKVEAMLKNATKPSNRIMDDEEVLSVFGLEL
ncbi:MAG: SWIM zinc finger family protein [Lachnospiraceae bacterium]|nr:SWIM zinc finger family protein [Lachnospiraceae bacterium]